MYYCRLAFLKRYITIIIGLRAIYVRPPSEDPDTPIFRIAGDDAHLDLLCSGHKRYYGLWKQGKNESYPEYEAAVEKEQQTIKDIDAATANLSDEKAIMQWWLTSIMGHRNMVEKTIPLTPLPPPSQEPLVIPAEADGSYLIPIPKIGTAPRRESNKKRRPFRFPSKALGVPSSSGIGGSPALLNALKAVVIKDE